MFQFHQTLKTYLNDRVWDFHFYVAKNWPDQPVILHFPGMTKTVSDKDYRERLSQITMFNHEILYFAPFHLFTKRVFFNFVTNIERMCAYDILRTLFSITSNIFNLQLSEQLKSLFQLINRHIIINQSSLCWTKTYLIK